VQLCEALQESVWAEEDKEVRRHKEDAVRAGNVHIVSRITEVHGRLRKIRAEGLAEEAARWGKMDADALDGEIKRLRAALERAREQEDVKRAEQNAERMRK
jgi:hypothetical protein